ncbi:MAG: GNAT family N-acetyltransferase [Alphaproteobacteria bacterium]|nr:GNAT family N-acetyltransferase [Alphaproteobacteria bacterium]
MAATGADLRLVSERLVLRRPVPSDASAIAAYIIGSDIPGHMPLLPDPFSIADAEEWIAGSSRPFDESGVVDLIICRQDAQLVGAIRLGRRPDSAGEVAYWIGAPHRRQGFAAEAVRTLVTHAFTQLGLSRVVATVLPHNAASRGVLARLGFVRRGEETRSYPRRGETRTLELHALDAPECGVDPALPPLPTILVAAVALVDADGRVLIAQRPPGKSMAGLWEFPGGKVQEGETPEVALVRELREELGIDTAGSCLAPFTFASHRYERFHLLMPLYLCRRWQGTPSPREGQTLAWVKPMRLADYPMPPADVPLVAMLRDFL